MSNTLIQDVAQKMAPFQNAGDLTACFETAVKFASKPPMMIKKYSSALMASDDVAEIDTFAQTYASALQSLGITQSAQVTTVSWKDLVDFPDNKKGTHGIDALKVDSAIAAAFQKAAGGVLLVQDTYASTLGRSADSFAAVCLRDRMERMEYDRDPATPVVVFAGKPADVHDSYGGSDIRFDMKTVCPFNTIGIKP